MPCPNKCDQLVGRCEVEAHLREECPNEIIPCLFHNLGCEVRVKRKYAQNHVQECKEKYIVKSHESINLELNALNEEMVRMKVVLKSELTEVRKSVGHCI